MPHRPAARTWWLSDWSRCWCWWPASRPAQRPPPVVDQRIGLSAPRSGYLVYWDQDEEVDYYESANHSQGQLMAPWDLNGQVCLLNDGTGRWVGGSDPTNESQHNPGGPPTYPFKQPAISEEMNDVNGNFTGKTLYVPGPYRMAPGLPGEDSPPDPTGIYNGQATYTGCAVDAQHNVFANDIGTAQGAFPIPTTGGWSSGSHPPTPPRASSTGRLPVVSGSDHDDGTGGLAQPGMMTTMPNGNLLVPQAGSSTGGLPGRRPRVRSLVVPHQRIPVPGRRLSTGRHHLVGVLPGLASAICPSRGGWPRIPTCGCYAISCPLRWGQCQ